MNLREMIRLSIEDSERWRGRRQEGRKPADRGASPERPYRAEEQLKGPDREMSHSRKEDRCRVIGFIPLSKGSNSELPPGEDHW
jgi:hypothetical protein